MCWASVSKMNWGAFKHRSHRSSVAEVFLQLPAVALPGLQVATYRLTEVFARPVNNSLVAHATAQIWLCLSC
jgi:hypothetical protein